MLELWNGYILTVIFISVVATVSVMAVERMLVRSLELLDRNRKWLLPLFSVVFGVLYYLLYVMVEVGSYPDPVQTVFFGMMIGSFSTTFHAVIKKGIVEQVQKFFRNPKEPK